MYNERHQEKVDEYIFFFFYNNKHSLPHLSHAQINRPHLLEEFFCHDQLQYNEGNER